MQVLSVVFVLATLAVCGTKAAYTTIEKCRIECPRETRGGDYPLACAKYGEIENTLTACVANNLKNCAKMEEEIIVTVTPGACTSDSKGQCSPNCEPGGKPVCGKVNDMLRPYTNMCDFMTDNNCIKETNASTGSKDFAELMWYGDC